MRKLLQSLFLLLMVAVQALAQERTVTGTVTGKEDGLPLPGVSITVTGTNLGTQSGFDGKFAIKVPAGKTSLKFSYLGYSSQTIAVGTDNVVNPILVADAQQLGEVVVTGALGIKRQAKELGYSTATVGSKDLNQTNVTNVANGLTAKVSGLQVNTVNNGIDPSLRVTLRGNRSINGNNNALVVLDGVPIPGGSLSSINPNDVQDINILKGASAAALYGSEASNGALIITTKRAASNGKPTIKYGNSFQANQVSYFPDFQKKFGLYGGEAEEDGFIDPLTGFAKYVNYENQQYGPAFDGSMVQLGSPLENGEKFMVPYSALAKHPIESFFNKGITEQNDFSYQSGDIDNSFYMSAQNVLSNGVVPDDKSRRTSLRVSGAKKFGMFKADYSVSYANTNVGTYGINYSTNTTSQILYANLFTTGAFIDLNQIKDPSGKYGNPNDFYSAYSINPYWNIKNSRINQKRDVFMGNLNLSIKPTDWFDASYRISQNFGVNTQKATRQEVVFSPYALSDPQGASTIPSRFRATGKVPGFVQDYTQYGDGTNNLNFNTNGGLSRLQQDVFLNFHHTFFNDFKADLLLGNTIWQSRARTQIDQSANLLIPEFYNISAIGGVPTVGQSEYFVRQIGAYGSLNVGYKDFAFIAVTGRNDWDSRLSVSKRSFFYPSVSGSFVFTNAFDALKDNNILNYGKLRAAFSEVGQVNIGPYSINNTFGLTSGFPFGSTGGLSLSTTNNNPLLEPEKVRELEVGGEFGLFNSRIDLKAAYFKQNSRNQTLSVRTSASTGFSQATINAGEIENSGTEFDLNLNVLERSQNKVGLSVGGNFGVYNSKVVSLIPGNSIFQIVGTSTSIYAEVGQPYPSLRGSDFVRDPEGHVVVNAADGYPRVSSVLSNYGRTTAKYILGLNTSVNYKFATLSAVAEYRGGNVIYNAIGSTMTFGGSSAYSTLADRQRFVFPNSVIETSPGVYTPNTSISIQDGNYGFWQESNFNSAIAPYVNSAAFWKLREVSLAFDLNQFINKTKFVKGLSLALTGRNLLMFRPKDNMWTDPEFNLDNTNAIGQTNINQLPPTRVFGANLQVTF
jgi:TonB-linked SusC/RagA family outer membrane protein